MRDLMGKEMLVRNYLVEQAVKVFRNFGYEPLDSPVIELWETLSAKGGEDVEAETFKFEDKGGRAVGLRFDLTVPLARIVASNPHLPKPFKRYAVGKAWRYDRPQAGRYREFMQADVDVVGSVSPAADAEVVLVALEFSRRILKKDYFVRINNRKVLKGLTEIARVPDELAHECFRSIDKLDKIGTKGVLEELSSRGISKESSQILLDALELRGKGIEILDKFGELLKESEIGIEGVDELRYMAEIFEEASVTSYVEYDMSLARGLDYYTGPVFEGVYIGTKDLGSIFAGGRYDRLIERFGGQPTPATGIALGIGRLVDVVIAMGETESLGSQLQVFIAPLKRPMVPYAARLANEFAREDISVEFDLMERSLKKLLGMADSKGARFTIIVGPKDLETGKVSIRDMQSKETEQVKLEDAVSFVTSKM
jgi:histidyl-tRNA synthetase